VWRWTPLSLLCKGDLLLGSEAVLLVLFGSQPILLVLAESIGLDHNQPLMAVG